MAKKPVSQSRTEWVEKGTIVNGRKVKKGYLAQKGKPEKKVTGRVALVTGQSSLGATSTYKKGRLVKATSAKKPAASTKSSSPASKTGSGSKGMANPPKVGTIRRGAAGRRDNRWDGKRWVPVATTKSSEKGRDSAMAGRKGMSATSKPATAATSATVSSAMAAKKGSYQAGTGGGAMYQKALTKGRTRKYGADTPGNRAAAAVGAAVSNVFTTRSDAQVAANNKRVAEAERKKRVAAAAALKKRREELKNRGR